MFHPPPTSSRRRGSAGWTLIELAIAAGLVAVLVALALPMYDGWRRKVQVQRAQDDIIAMAAVIDTFLLDNGRLPASLAEVGRGGMADPWGRAYQYLALTTPAAVGKARKDHALVPLNSDYDLYSKGPDGATAAPLTAKASRDDILRAGNGRFVGPADLY